MNPTKEEQHVIDATNEVRRGIVDKALENARHHERMLRSNGPDVDKRYHAGAIDAYVAILKQIEPNERWLDYIRATA